MPLSTVFFESSPKPMYEQLYLQIRRDMEAGQLQPGEKLPSKRVLCHELGVSQNTVEAAYEQLIVEGYLHAVPRSGYFVQDLRPMAPLVQKKATPGPASEKAKSRAPDHDLSTSTVDTTRFPFETWARLTRRVIRDEHSRLLNGSPRQGDLKLRQTLAEYLERYRAVRCCADQILIGAGTEYLLGLIVQILGRRGRFGVEDPGSAMAYKVLQSHGATTVPVAVDEQGVSIDSLQQTRANRILVTPSHQFPLGMVMPASRRQQLLQWAQEGQDRYIIEDDYDNEFRFAGRPVPSLQGLDRSDKTIYLGTFSKSIAPSIRISYMALPSALMERYRKDFSFYASTVSRFEQKVLALFLQEGYFERHLNKMRKLYRQRQKHLIQAIEGWPFSDSLQLGGLDAGLHLRLGFASHLTEESLVRAAAKQGVKVYALSQYEKQEPCGTRPPTILLGYAHLDSDSLTAAAGRLCLAWRYLCS